MKRIFILSLIATLSVSAEKPRSVLNFSVPHKMEDANIRVQTDIFRDDDYVFDDSFSMARAFTGGDEVLLKKFNETMKDPIYTQGVVPSLNKKAAGPVDFTIHTYYKPYEYNQSRFLEWTKENLGRDDFLPKNARKKNDYRGDLISPIVMNKADRKALDLRKTFGKYVSLEENKLTFFQDNRLNPLRWMAPFNLIHHHETSSTFITIGLGDTTTDEELANIFRNYWRGIDRSKHILLRYKIRVKLTNHAEEMGERTIFDLYEKGEFENPDNLITHQHNNVIKHAEDEEVPPGMTESFHASYMKKRLENPFLQVSVAVNFKEELPYYFNQEFMVVNKDYASTTKGFSSPVLNETLAADMYEGGAEATEDRLIGWNRLPVDALKNLDEGSDIKGYPIFREGGECVEWSGRKDRVLETTVSGTIDLTHYFLHSRANGFFPAEFFKDNAGKLQGFGVKGALHHHPDLPIGMSWAGVMFEMTGPYELEMETQEFDIVIAENL